MGHLLQPVGNGPHRDIAAQSWRGPEKVAATPDAGLRG